MNEKAGEKIQKRKTKRKYSLPDKGLKFEKEIAILKGLVEFSEKGSIPVSYKDIKGLASKARVSSELAFFADAGLAQKEKGAKYLPIPEVIKLVNYLNNEKEKEAKEILRQLLINSWFGLLTKQILSVKNKIKKRELTANLSAEAEGNLKKDEKAVAKLIEWLKYAEIIEIDDDDYVYLSEDPTSTKERAILPIPEETEDNLETLKKSGVELREIKKIQKGLLLNLTINLQIDSNTDVEKIKEIIRVIKQNLVEDTAG